MEQRILHIDFNAFFASVEQQSNPQLRNKPVGVGARSGDRSVIVTASYEAKERGVKTPCTVADAKKMCPDILVLRGDGKKYTNISLRFQRILERVTPNVRRVSIDEAFVDLTDCTDDWFDCLGIALRLRETIASELGSYIRVSIGIASNKLLAKIASGSDKPNGLTIVYPGDEESFLDTLALSDITGIGKSILRHLEELGIVSIPQLRNVPLLDLQTYFGRTGYFLYYAVRGSSQATIREYPEEPKSVGHGYTFPSPTQHPDDLRGQLLHLATRVAERLRRYGLAAAKCRIAIATKKQATQYQLSLPCPTQQALLIFSTAWPILSDVSEAVPIKFISITGINLVPSHAQYSLNRHTNRYSALLPKLDTIHKKYGRHSWTYASTLLRPSIAQQHDTKGAHRERLSFGIRR